MNKASDTQGVATVDMWVAGKRQRATATRLGDITAMPLTVPALACAAPVWIVSHI